jgi:6-phosphogluconolactonase
MTGEKSRALALVLALLAAGLLPPAAAPAQTAEAKGSGAMRVYIGTYTERGSRGVYLASLDLATGRLELDGVAAELVNPSFVAIHPSQRYLYAIGEIGEFNGEKGGAVSALAIDPASGKLTLLNQKSSRGVGPCHVSVDRSGKVALVANYGGGSVACLPIAADGSLGDATAFIQHQGSSANPQRQEGPHAHSINVDPANRFAFVADLGLDKVFSYRLDATRGLLAANDPPCVKLAAGDGPRHFAFHPSGRYAYVINEMHSTVTGFRYDADRGALETIESVTTLPAGFSGSSSTAEVQVHPSGKFLYGSNRGHDSIAVFAIDSETGKLTPLGHTSTQGKTPRNFGIDPTGHWLLAANQDSGSIVAFRIDQETGKLSPTGQSISVPMAVCVKFMPLVPTR